MHAFSELSVVNASFVNEVFGAITDVVSRSDKAQGGYDLWVWEPTRPCRGQSYVFLDDSLFKSNDRPCSWKLPYVCSDRGTAMASTRYTAEELSDAWLLRMERSLEAPSPMPPPAVAASAGAAAGGMTLVVSNLVIGFDTVPPGATWYDGTDTYRTDGPLVSLLWRVGPTNQRLEGLLPLHEGNPAAPGFVPADARAFHLLKTPANISGQPGFIGASTGEGATWEGRHVGPWHDYLTRVQGCHSPGGGLQRLALVSRTGAVQVVGRSDCGARFSEEAPPGGYLAALQVWHSNATTRPRTGAFADAFTIHQVRLVWASPDPAATPASLVGWVQPLPAVAASSCPAAAVKRPMQVNVANITQVYECGPRSGLVCGSNTCCGDNILDYATRLPVQVCGRGLGPCLVSCRSGWGYCGPPPEVESLLFTHTPPDTRLPAILPAGQLPPAAERLSASRAAAGPQLVLSADVKVQMTYPVAVEYCRSLTQLGLSWSLLELEDVVALWGRGLDVRVRANNELFGKLLWVARTRFMDEVAPPGMGCLRAAFDFLTNEWPLHQVTPSSCTVTALTVCRANASQATANTQLTAGAAAAAATGTRASANSSSAGASTSASGTPARFLAGMNLLSVSRTLGAGPNAALPACGFRTLASFPQAAPVAAPAAILPSSNSTNNTSSSGGAPSSVVVVRPTAAAPSSGGGAGATMTAELTLAVSAIRVSRAVVEMVLPDGPTEQVSGLQLVLGGVEEEVLGSASSGGWDNLQLQVQLNEAVVAVSGCAGTYLEQVVFITSLGRRLAPPASSGGLCTAPFYEAAPPGGVLVGLQGTQGYFIEQLQLVWAQPLSVLAPPASPAGSGGGSSGGLSQGAAIGIGVGVACAGVALLAVALAGLAHVRRRRRAPRLEAVVAATRDGAGAASASAAEEKSTEATETPRSSSARLNCFTDAGSGGPASGSGAAAGTGVPTVALSVAATSSRGAGAPTSANGNGNGNGSVTGASSAPSSWNQMPHMDGDPAAAVAAAAASAAAAAAIAASRPPLAIMGSHGNIFARVQLPAPAAAAAAGEGSGRVALVSATGASELAVVSDSGALEPLTNVSDYCSKPVEALQALNAVLRHDSDVADSQRGVGGGTYGVDRGGDGSGAGGSGFAVSAAAAAAAQAATAAAIAASGLTAVMPYGSASSPSASGHQQAASASLREHTAVQMALPQQGDGDRSNLSQTDSRSQTGSFNHPPGARHADAEGLALAGSSSSSGGRGSAAVSKGVGVAAVAPSVSQASSRAGEGVRAPGACGSLDVDGGGGGGGGWDGAPSTTPPMSAAAAAAAAAALPLSGATPSPVPSPRRAATSRVMALTAPATAAVAALGLRSSSGRQLNVHVHAHGGAGVALLSARAASITDASSALSMAALGSVHDAPPGGAAATSAAAATRPAAGGACVSAGLDATAQATPRTARFSATIAAASQVSAAAALAGGGVVLLPSGGPSVNHAADVVWLPNTRRAAAGAQASSANAPAPTATAATACAPGAAGSGGSASVTPAVNSVLSLAAAGSGTGQHSRALTYTFASGSTNGGAATLGAGGAGANGGSGGTGGGSTGDHALEALLAAEAASGDPSLAMRLGVDVDIDEASYLGHGASGVVRRGVLHTPAGDVPVAVKLLMPPDGTEAAAGVHAGHLRGLAQEVRVLSRLAHPNVVRFFGACLDPPPAPQQQQTPSGQAASAPSAAVAHRPFIVEELMATSLNKILHGKSRTTGAFAHEYGLADVLCVARDVAAGLSYLHPTVVHRDLKPGNVLLDKYGTAKISDFGLARFKANTALTTAEIEVGTAPYMAPEVFLANADVKVTDRADVYSLGIIMNELVTRQKPWEGMRPVVVGFQVAMERKRPPLPGPDHPLCPPGLRSLIERCLRHNPEERPSSAEIAKRLTLLLAEHCGDLGLGPAGATAAAAATAATAARSGGSASFAAGTGSGSADSRTIAATVAAAAAVASARQLPGSPQAPAPLPLEAPPQQSSRAQPQPQPRPYVLRPPYHLPNLRAAAAPAAAGDSVEVALAAAAQNVAQLQALLQAQQQQQGLLLGSPLPPGSQQPSPMARPPGEVQGAAGVVLTRSTGSGTAGVDTPGVLPGSSGPTSAQASTGAPAAAVASSSPSLNAAQLQQLLELQQQLQLQLQQHLQQLPRLQGLPPQQLGARQPAAAGAAALEVSGLAGSVLGPTGPGLAGGPGAGAMLSPAASSSSGTGPATLLSASAPADSLLTSSTAANTVGGGTQAPPAAPSSGTAA
ncbi:hypothetical protein HYH02_004272 [Chlamydomonas schloesseri]|uniref:Protein kinase domain-containing protein n=1 Tax=Chlamydomonas schloesseri TaxID=2026947 RepID=A0A835WNM2_9CHLO|nr:hypothetical protein HYH02_004272 [Chlamydomonas schloesseri]|eukprot:KAG2451002.1 hypothetical protein HYH02_004272 [Chlamydomonas schloesseri]